jgi:hypothetical protein
VQLARWHERAARASIAVFIVRLACLDVCVYRVGDGLVGAACW